MEDLKLEWAPLDRFRSEGLDDLLAAHHTEVALDRDVIPLDPDWDRYYAVERAGQFKALGAWRAGKLIGYNAFFVFRPYHYRQIHAFNDVIYLDPEARGEAGIRLILTAERGLFADGAVKIVYHTKRHVLLAAGARGEPGDSLDNIERLVEIEREFGLELPDDAMSADFTLGGLLARMGYRHDEDCFAKVRVA